MNTILCEYCENSPIMGKAADMATCPFCPFSDSDCNFVSDHIEYCHPENGIQSDVDHGRSLQNASPHSNGKEEEEEFERYIHCPHSCGEIVANTELSTHLDLHFAEGIALEGADSAPEKSPALGTAPENFGESLDEISQRWSPREREFSQTEPRKGNIAHSPTNIANSGVKRLGRAELGPHAHEKRMPSWLKKMLEKGAKTTQSNRITSDGMLTRHETVENETSGIIKVLARLCEQDQTVQRAVLCSPKVRHIFKMPREGGFCGYRNIQMLVSYIQENKSLGHENFNKKSPTILELQEMIENAWDIGFNSVGRVETGGIRGTRKFIGTPEAQALLLSLNIPCEANSISQTSDIRAYDALYEKVISYFRSACALDGNDKKVVTTNLPPIYFQHQGHSLTIVGFEIRDNGSANLLVFDPMFKTSPAVKRLIGTDTKSPDPARVLKAHRRGAAYLQKYKVFEILKLTIPEPSSGS